MENPLRAVLPKVSYSRFLTRSVKSAAPVALVGAALITSACGTESPPDFSSTGGATARGGQTAAGGASGGTVANGGAPSFGGVAGASSGGTTSTNGGTVSAGGAPAAGGSSAGKGGSVGSAGSGAGGASGGASGGAASGGAGGASGGSAAGGKTSGGAGGAAGSTGTGGSAGAGDGKSAGCGKARTLTNGRKTIQSGGNREYILRVPDDYSNTKPYRLIFAFHWRDGNANQVANGGMGGSTEDPFYGLWDLAKGSTIFIAPEGLNAGWQNSMDRDIALTDAILDAVQKDLCIDTTRIFSTGFSFGAGMSYALACARPNVFRGVALYAGAQLSGCNGGTKPVAYFHAHGIRDSVLNISQGRPLRDRFVMNNGCTSQSPPEPNRNSGTHTCTSYAGCSAGYPVRWCAFDGDHNPTEKDSGQSKSWVPGEAWQFISQF